MSGILYKDSGSRFESWDEFVKYNRTLPCSNPRCNNLRHNRGKLCSNCSRYCTSFGDPNLRAIKLKVFMEEIHQVEDLILFNYGNPLIVDFVDKITRICDDSGKGLPIEYAHYFKHMDTVLKRGMTKGRRSSGAAGSFKRDAYGLLAELTGFYIFAEKDYHEVVKTDQLYDYMIGDIALAGVKGNCKPNPTGKRVRRFSKVFQDMFSIYWIKIYRAIKMHEQEEQKRKEMLANASFKIPKKGE